MPENNISVLAVDLGATSGRAILGRLTKGELSLTEVHRFPNKPLREAGTLRWDAHGLWREIRAGIALGASTARAPLASVGVDAWGVDYALLGESGELLESPYHYRDSRTAGMMEKALAILGAEHVYDVTGTQFMPINTLFQLYAEWQSSPRLIESAAALVNIPDLMNYWLSGRIASEYTIASTTQMLDRKSRRWASGLLSGLGVPHHLLREIVAPGTALGGLRSELKTSPELAATCVIAPACHDTGSAVAAIRTGEGVAFLSSGTWSLLGAEVQETVVNPESFNLNFTNEGSVGGAYRLLRNITGMWLLEECRRAWEEQGRSCEYGELLELAAKAEPLAFLMDPDDPAFSAPGDMPRAICDYASRTGQKPPQSPGAFTRAILESLALKYRFALEKLAIITGRPFHELRIIGGGCRNNMLNQFVADATGCRVSAGPVEATALGNIAMQLVGLGAVDGVAEARDLIERAFPPAKFEPAGRGAWDHAYSNFLTLAPR